MPLEQTITIVNNSGKIISNGKQLFSIFTDAKNSYLDKKSEIKQLKRAQTFQEEPRHRDPSYDQENYHYAASRPPLTSRRSYDAQSVASSRHSHRSRSQSRYHEDSTPRSRSRPPLTLANLKTHSEVSSTTPSRRTPPNAYRAPSQMEDARTMAMTQRAPGHLARRRSESQMGDPLQHGGVVMKKPKAVDMDLAYGNVPPDLEHMPEYNPQFQDPNKERQAKFLVGKVEGLLGEAQCLQSSAGTIIKRLQEDPNAAASVALTLSELSKVAAKMSPAFLGLLKGSSPAVFGLLASPQFLIGTSVLAGVTVVMFGGWKIVQKVKENQQAREALAIRELQDGRPALPRTQTDLAADGGHEEALVIDDDISTIESWRRGIPFGDDASADFELITPQADRAKREIDDDARSRRTTKTSRDVKKSSKDKDVPERKSSRRAESVAGSEAPERKSSRRAESVAGSEAPERKSSRRVAESVAGSERSERSSASRKKHSSSSSSVGKSESKSKKKESKPSEEGSRGRSSSRRGDELVVRPRGAESNNMLKAMFRSKEKERQLVLA